MASVHKYWINTSKQSSIGILLSIMFSLMACFNAAASTNSKALVGRKYNLLISPGPWPLLPALCKKRATPFGEPTWITVSTGLKSTPRSRLAVHTTAFSFWVCKASSTQSLNSCSILPWCKAMAPANCGAAVNKLWYHVSLMPRVLIKINVVLLFSMTGTKRCTILIPKCPAQG